MGTVNVNHSAAPSGPFFREWEKEICSAPGVSPLCAKVGSAIVAEASRIQMLRSRTRYNSSTSFAACDSDRRLSKLLDIPGFSTSAASFEVPLEMLAACHGRIRSQCSTLLRLRSHVARAGADAAARKAAQGVIRYFDTSARHHHEDEEQDLFPALIESMAGADPVCIRELIDSLTRDHRELERLWVAVRAWLVDVEAGEAAAASAADIDSFVDLYERHAAREEQELFPMSERLLGAEELDRIGRSMRLRRGIDSA